MILDRSTLITGSFNFTKAAEEKNAENLLILKGNKLLVDRYIRNFINVLNIAGPRESKCPGGIYKDACSYLEKVFQLLKETKS